ncbi:FHA domain-containing protein [Paenibacillus dakarensis]|uniref:FHA domain-containing protein n=1 Tax=Paenibacillus dakarensis TaxID=1527293 RepID=UPI0006D576B8
MNPKMLPKSHGAGGASGYKIKDLGSKNGTILKGEPMVPYKEYPLQEGDVFQIAGSKYMFRASPS